MAALITDVHLFAAQLASAVREDERRRLLLGRIEDVLARLETLDRDLRHLAYSLQPSGLVERPFQQALRHEIENFERSASVRVKLDSVGDFDSLTPSQRLALLQVIRGALSNVRKHSRATVVHISLAAEADRVAATIADDGRGFDVERELLRAARRGRLGLVGMAERIHLLGGTFEVRSRPGEATVVSVQLRR